MGKDRVILLKYTDGDAWQVARYGTKIVVIDIYYGKISEVKTIVTKAK